LGVQIRAIDVPHLIDASRFGTTMSKNASEVTENAGPALKMVASNKAVWKIVTEGVPPFF